MPQKLTIEVPSMEAWAAMKAELFALFESKYFRYEIPGVENALPPAMECLKHALDYAIPDNSHAKEEFLRRRIETLRKEREAIDRYITATANAMLSEVGSWHHE